MYKSPLEGLVEHRLLDLNPRMSDFVGLAWDLSICISSTFQSNAAAVDPGMHFENDSPRRFLSHCGLLETEDKIHFLS